MNCRTKLSAAFPCRRFSPLSRIRRHSNDSGTGEAPLDGDGVASALDLAGSPGEGEYLTMACLFGDVGGIGDIAGRVGAILIFPGDEGSPFVRVPNVFAIPGLCSLSLTLAGVMDKIHSLKTGFGVVLTFGCVKMLLVHSPWKIDTHLSLCVIDRVLAD